MAFDNLRKSLEEMMARATKPEERRDVAHRMRETLVQAKVGLSEMQDALNKARMRLTIEERELETVRRRRELAQNINDAETVAVATKYEATHTERVELLRKKVAVQEDEIRMAEADVDAMSNELRSAATGTGEFAPATPATPATAMPDTDDDGAPLASEIERLGRARRRAEHDANADAKLEELKRRMGK